jgi:hypothetical protein
MSEHTQDRLIASLAQGLRPVRRVGSPWRRTLLWLGAVAGIALVLARFAQMDALAAKLGAAPDMWLSVVGSVATAVLAGVAAIQTSMPDRSPAWALLPLPAAALWLGACGAGCLRALVDPILSPITAAEMPDCLGFIVAFSVPLSALMLVLLRRACPLRPGLTAALGGLACASASASLLVLFHPFDASFDDLLVHALAVGIVVLANRRLGGKLLGTAT